ADQARSLLESTDLRAELNQRLPVSLQRYVHFRSEPAAIEDALGSALSGGANVVSHAFSKAAEVAIGLFLSVIAMYYFFLDGERLVREAARLLPLDGRYFDAFAKEFKDVTYAIM